MKGFSGLTRTEGASPPGPVLLDGGIVWAYLCRSSGLALGRNGVKLGSVDEGVLDEGAVDVEVELGVGLWERER